jgi:NAD-dependent deacetylase
MVNTDLTSGATGTVQDLTSLVGRSRRIVAFTGAGISTECGVPDFRSPGSPWMRTRPIPFDEFVASDAVRRRAWAHKFEMDDSWRGAKPGRGHLAIRRLADEGRLAALITQNIDNLHQDSGLPADLVIELHGNATYAGCLACGMRHELVPVRARFEATGEAPACDACGGMVKSATVSFGQSMPEEAMRRAHEAVAACDLMIAIGSSLVVQPAARFPAIAKKNGAVLAIVNREPTPLDPIADIVLRGDIGTVMQQVVDNVRFAS